MSGIYFHIPYCRSKCNYCNFFVTSNFQSVNKLIQSEREELKFRKNFNSNEVVSTIYFGGGTPSVLPVRHIRELLNVVRSYYKVSSDCEITLEANPEDLTEEYLVLLFESGINRLSIGIQSFDDNILFFLGRRHDASFLIYIIQLAKKVGFKNISVDLIYGIPGMTLDIYLNTLNEFIKLDVQHLSAYALTIEEQTLFYKLLKNSQLSIVPEEEVIAHFASTIKVLKNKGYLHYEVSNFAKEGYISRHNSSYWTGVGYIGIGPSAHSYNGVTRQWNVSSIKNYCLNVEQGNFKCEIEELSEIDIYNEYILLGLRTSSGISDSYVCNKFSKMIYNHFFNEILKLKNCNFIECNDDRIILNNHGIFVADFIIEKLFYI